MSDENTTVTPVTTPAPAPSADERIKALENELARMRTNPRNLPTVLTCNVCGDKVEEGKRCSRHPFDLVNHLREGLPGEPDIVLVKQV